MPGLGSTEPGKHLVAEEGFSWSRAKAEDENTKCKHHEWLWNLFIYESKNANI